tara:strand:+ start:49 stop:654 length:606 start_codon:yes stop_codon:yes gene_type:complete
MELFMKQDKQKLIGSGVAPNPKLAEMVLDPAYISAALVTIWQDVGPEQIDVMISELKRQTEAIHDDDLSRVEGMLIAQAHTLDALFAKLSSRAFGADQIEVMERYLRLALKSQSQARATLQTLAEVKMPKQVAFVRQANIGNQVQVNNGRAHARARKNANTPNEVLEADHGKRMDTRASSTASGIDSTNPPLGAKQRPEKR